MPANKLVSPVSLAQEAVVFGALALGLGTAAWWRWTHPADFVAAEGARAGLWLLVSCAAGLVLQLAGFV